MYPGRLRYLRTEAKQTHKDLSTYLGITRQGYGNYENGITEPDNETLKKLADHFDVSIDYLVGRTNNRGESNEVGERRGDSRRINVTEQMRIDYFDKLNKLSDEHRKIVEAVIESYLNKES